MKSIMKMMVLCAIISLFTNSGKYAQASSVIRTISSMSINGGEIVNVTLSVSTGGSANYAIEEDYPYGWTVVSSDGITNQYGVIKWAAISGASDTTLTYTLMAPNIEGVYYFGGNYVFEGTGEFNIGGQNLVVVNAEPNALPEVLSTKPIDKQLNVVDTDSIFIAFSKNMDKVSTEAGINISPSISYSSNWLTDNILILTPTVPLGNGVKYTVRVSANAKDLMGYPFDGNANGIPDAPPLDDYVFRFTVVESLMRGNFERYFSKSIMYSDEIETVTIVVNHYWVYYLIEDKYPEGWSIIDIDGVPATPNRSKDVRIANLSPNTAITVHTYRVKPGGATGQFGFDGKFIQQGMREMAPIAGSYLVKVESPSNIPNRTPFAEAGSDQVVSVGDNCSAMVTLNGTGSTDPDGDNLSFTWTWPFGTASGATPRVSLPLGTHTILLTVNDGKGGTGTDTVTITVQDNMLPAVSIKIPQPTAALQDGVTFVAEASDNCGIGKVYFYLREQDGGNGTSIGFENLTATFDTASGRWEYAFNTTQLSDGYYVLIAKGVDSNGNEGWSSLVSLSIRNWAVLKLLPTAENNKAGRTMPVKFALRIDAAVDSLQPFVYNEELEIRIYDGALNSLLQTSVWGVTSKDYRIDTVGKLYISNFKTDTKPATYRVEIWRKNRNFMIGSFSFKTVK